MAKLIVAALRYPCRAGPRPPDVVCPLPRVGENVCMPSTVSRVITSLAVAGVLALAVSACASETDATPAESPSATPTPTASETPEPTATQAPISVGNPISIDCNTLVDPDAIYDFNPNLALSASYTPAAGSEAATIVEAKGLACAWINQTSGEIVEVAVADLPSDKLTDLKNNFVMTSNPVPTYKVEGYFTIDGSVGRAEAFNGPYWISATSDAFLEPGDAEPIIKAALAGIAG